MKELFTGIYSKFNATNTFKTAMGGRLYLHHADQENAVFPYCVYSQISGTSDWTFSDDEEHIMIQFSIFSQKNSATEVETSFGYLKTLFDDAALTVSGWTSVYMQRGLDRLTRDDENDVWQHDVEYSVMLEKLRT